jgi:HEAT repeat protein
VYSFLVAVIAALATTFVGLTLLIAVNKAWRDGRERRLRIRRRQLEPALNAYLHGSERSLLAALGGQLALRDRLAVEQLLLEHAHEADAVEREKLARAFDEAGFVDGYLRRLRSRSGWRRADAAERLGLAAASRAIDELTAAMEDDSTDVRLRAAKALGRIGGLAAMRPLIRALDEPNRWSTVRVAEILTLMGREVGDQLVASFEALSPRARVAAIDVLAGIRHLNIAPWLRERLAERDPDVRSRAAHALGVVGDLDAGPELVSALADGAWPVRAMAAKSLGLLLQVDAIPLLCQALRDPEWWVRANAAEALRLMGPVGLGALRDVLDDPDVYARHQAVFMLEESGVVDEEVELLAHPGPDRRAQAGRFVSRVARTGQDGRLRELADGHADAEVRRRLRELLADVAGRVEVAS